MDGTVNNETIPVLCFSKNRPLQLDGYIRSLIKSSGTGLKLSVLYSSDGPFKESYEELAALYPDVKFLPETNFQQQVVSWLHDYDGRFLMFGCDDVLFKGRWDPDAVMKRFDYQQDLFSFSLRLGTEIKYCQPLDCQVPTPEFLQTSPVLIWNWREQPKFDWGLPFELNSTVQRRTITKSILQELTRLRIDWGHPNKLEVAAARIAPAVQGFSLMGSLTTSVSCCLTINRVQQLIPFPVYENQGISPEDLLQMWKQGFRLDIDRYQDRIYDRVHIGDAFFIKPDVKE